MESFPSVFDMTKLLVIENNNLMTSFPELLKAFYLFFTLPVTVASAERSFSKLKLIKSYLRNTMSQTHLSGLYMISIENENAKKFNMSDTNNRNAISEASNWRNEHIRILANLRGSILFIKMEKRLLEEKIKAFIYEFNGLLNTFPEKDNGFTSSLIDTANLYKTIDNLTFKLNRQEDNQIKNNNKNRYFLSSGNKKRKQTFTRRNQKFKNHGKIDLLRTQMDSLVISQSTQPINTPRINRNNDISDNGMRVQHLLRTTSKRITGWYSVYIQNVNDPEDLLNEIQALITPSSLYPYKKQIFNNVLSFLVDDFNLSKQLKSLNNKITQKNNQKIKIKTHIYLPTLKCILYTPVPNEVKEKIKEALMTCYDSDTKSMNLSRFHSCSIFTENQLFVPLNQPTFILVTLNLMAELFKYSVSCLNLKNNHIYLGQGLIWIHRLFPDLKELNLADNKFIDFKELISLSGLSIEILNFSGNPICNTTDSNSYREKIQHLFPVLKILDNVQVMTYSNAINYLSMPISIDNVYPILDGYDPTQPNPIKTFVESFIFDYFRRFDNKPYRKTVIDGYHDNATFSLSSCYWNKEIIPKSNVSYYIKQGRNLLFNSNTENKLHRRKNNLINFFNKFPNTKHDIDSFVIDIPFIQEYMVQIIVKGVFIQDFKKTNKFHIFRSFYRNFLLVPNENNWLILNDMMFVSVVTNEIIQESVKRCHVDESNTLSLINNSSNGNSSKGYPRDAQLQFPKEKHSYIKSSLFQPLPTQGVPFDLPVKSYEPGLESSVKWQNYFPVQLSSTAFSFEAIPEQQKVNELNEMVDSDVSIQNSSMILEDNLSSIIKDGIQAMILD